MIKKFLLIILTFMISGAFFSVIVFADDSYEGKKVKPVIEHHFEGTDYLSWQKNGNCNIRTIRTPGSSENDGNFCLKVDARHTFWDGPQLKLDSSSNIISGQSYIFKIKIYQESGKAQNIDLILKSVLSNNDDSYITINTKIKKVSSGHWTELSGTVTIPNNCLESYLYLETSDSVFDYCIDDLTITKNTTYHDLIPSNINDNDTHSNERIIFTSSFEENIPEVWYSKDSCRLSVQNRDPDLRYTGFSSMKVTNRSSSSDGPSIDLSKIVENNIRYTISCWLYLPNNNSEKMILTLEWKNSKGEITRKSFATLNILPNKWTKISGSVLIPSDAVSPSVCISSLNNSIRSNSRFNFYVDFFSITTNLQQEADNTDPSENKINKIFYGFESDDNNVTGKDKAVLYRTKDKKHSGKYSAFVSERKTDQSGIIFNINNIEPEVKYNVSAWVSYDIIDNAIKNDHTFYLSVHYYYKDENSINDEINNIIIDSNRIQNNEAWISLSGDFKIPDGAHDISLIINTKKNDGDIVQRVSSEKNDLISFYVDDVKIENTDYISNRQLFLRVLIIIFLAVMITITIFMIIRGKKYSHKY